MRFEPTPPFLRKQKAWYAAAEGAAALGLLAALWGVFPALGWMPLLLVPVVPVVGYAIRRSNQGLARRLGGGELPCWKCGYNLAATGEAGRCPECGCIYTAQRLQKQWENAARVGSRPLTRWPFARPH